MRIKVKVIPNAKRPEIIQEKEFLRVKVNAPAEKGKANKRLIEMLSVYFEISRSEIKIISGEKSNRKVIEIRYNKI